MGSSQTRTVTTLGADEAKSVEATALPEGYVCLDFANTIDPRYGEHVHDLLVDYDALVSWGARVGLLTEEQAGKLREAGRGQSAEAQLALSQAKDLRETIYRVFSATAAGRLAGAADLDALREAFAEAIRHARVTPGEPSYRLSWSTTPFDLDALLWPVA